MAKKLFKGFQQVTAGSFEAEAGYIYFVRNTANTGKTDGYLLFNGRKYGSAEEMGAVLNGRIGTLPEGYDNLVAYVNAQVSAITGEYATQDSVDAVEGRVDDLEAISADTRLNALEDDTHTHGNKDVLDGITSEKVASWDGVAGSADTRIAALEESATTWNNIAGSADTRIAALEAISADTRLNAIEGDYLKAADKTALETAIGAQSGRVDTIAADYLTSNDKTALQNSITAETAAREALEGRVDTLEAVSADTRLDALEAVSSQTHTHDNKSVLDGITAEKVAAWDAISGNAVVVTSAFTGDAATANMLKTYKIYQGGNEVGVIDIPKDMVVSSGQIVEENGVKYLRLTIANSNNTVDIAISDLAHVYTQGNGVEISNDDVISAKVVAGNGLSVDANGIAMGLADGSNAGAMSAADFAKLGTIEASAQTNVIETVKVNGTALTVTDKAVDITIPDYSNTYAPIALTGTVADNRTAFDTYTAATDGRLDALEAVSADTRLDALEAVSGQSHTHDNKSVLDGITSEKVASWDGVAGSADTRIAALEAISADTKIPALETSVSSAETRIAALEALTADTASALQSISAADNSVAVGAKDANNNQTVGVKISATANNALSLESDGLFAGIYYDGDDSN